MAAAGPLRRTDVRWRPSGTNQVEDRRGSGGGLGGLGMGGLGGGGGGIPIPMGSGIGGIILVIIIIVVMNLMGGGGGSGSPSGTASSLSPNDDMGQFVNAVTVDVQTFWEQEFADSGKSYDETVTVLFTDGTQTGCGTASSATGPFYCPADQKVFLDPGFFNELTTRFGAKGEFARAYVIAHEYGHHVQDLLGTMDQVQQQQGSGNANELSIRLELQADCLAGMWANWVKTHPDQSAVESITDQDVRDGLEAAAAVGDDRIQEQATGTVDKESWTHGSSEQRMKWFNTGLSQGSLQACDTFAVASP
jgi:predicted metalloprotease